MRSLEELDRWIAAKVKGWVGAPEQREFFEIRREILDDIRRHIEAYGAGRYTLSYNTIVLTVPREGEIQEDIRGLFAEMGHRCPQIEFVVNPEMERFRIEYLNRPIPEPKRPSAKLIVVQGEAEPREYEIVANRVNLGRMAEVQDEKYGLMRRNDIAFSEDETTISREHAHIGFDRSSGKFRIYDDQSTRGTNLFRDGRRIEVPRSSLRGIALESGDEIHLGNARLRFEIEAD